MFGRVVIAIVLLLLPGAAFAQAEKRIALLIGNRSYDTSVGVLKNPHNDIAVVGEALAKQGFELLPPMKDARRSTILGGVRELVRRLNAAGTGAIGFFYYSGHGAAEKDTNVNYLIPIDAKEPGTTAFWDESLKLEDILRLLDGARAAVKFIVFDACRNELQLPTKDTTKGLVPVIEQQGMFIAYASAPGRTASDRGDQSGPYAGALAAELGKPGLDHLNFFQNVKEAVLLSTGGAQQPWESNGLGRRVYLTGRPNPPAQPPARLSEAAEAWDRAKDTNSVTVLEAYISRFNGTFYADLARAQLEKLKPGQLNADQFEERLLSNLGIPTQMVPPRPFKEGSSATATPQRRTGMRLMQLDCKDTWARVGDDERCLKPGDSFKDCPECPEMVVVPAGEFMMGSPVGEEGRKDDESPQHKVTIAKPFAVGKFEVTFDEWKVCLAAGACKRDPSRVVLSERARKPVVYVSWDVSGVPTPRFGLSEAVS
jgi:uncharacterized caspase-like protein